MKVKILVVSLSAAVWLWFLQSANCQVPPGMQCNTSAGSAPSVASQGAAVLVADLILSCTGGTPTPPGQTVPQLNVQISLNVNVSSRILNNPLTEALLLLDEPDSKTQLACAQPNCANVAGAPVGPALDQNKNVFQGQLSASNSIVWPLVPIDPPGLSGVRVIRITNIRGNAPAVAVAGAPLVTLTELVSISGRNPPVVMNPQQTVAFLQPGLAFSVRRAADNAAGIPAPFSGATNSNFPMSQAPDPVST